jgi:D-alanyl-D-alanine carboxypeptidase
MLISRRDFLISGTALVASSCATAVTARDSRYVAPEFDRSGLEQLGAIAERAVSIGGTPGIALAVWKGGREIYSRYAGMANLEAGTRIVETSVFRIGSGLAPILIRRLSRQSMGNLHRRDFLT